MEFNQFEPRLLLENRHLHFFAAIGYYKDFYQKFKSAIDKNPINVEYGLTPLHLSAMNNHLAICQLILSHVEEKHPRDNNGFTPFHYSALNGHAKICSLFIQSTPKDDLKTALRKATQHYHWDICDLILQNMNEKDLKKLKKDKNYIIIKDKIKQEIVKKSQTGSKLWSFRKNSENQQDLRRQNSLIRENRKLRQKLDDLDKEIMVDFEPLKKDERLRVNVISR